MVRQGIGETEVSEEMTGMQSNPATLESQRDPQNPNRRAFFVIQPPPAPQPRVKPLVWRDARGDGTQWANTIFGFQYCASEKGWGFRNYPDQYPSGGGIEEAKAAAQADYSARILSALDSAPAPQPVKVKSQSNDIRSAGLKARDRLIERLAGTGSIDNDLADHLESIVDACVNAELATTMELIGYQIWVKSEKYWTETLRSPDRIQAFIDNGFKVRAVFGEAVNS